MTAKAPERGLLLWVILRQKRPVSGRCRFAGQSVRLKLKTRIWAVSGPFSGIPDRPHQQDEKSMPLRRRPAWGLPAGRYATKYAATPRGWLKYKDFSRVRIPYAPYSKKSSKSGISLEFTGFFIVLGRCRPEGFRAEMVRFRGEVCHEVCHEKNLRGRIPKGLAGRKHSRGGCGMTCSTTCNLLATYRQISFKRD